MESITQPTQPKNKNSYYFEPAPPTRHQQKTQHRPCSTRAACAACGWAENMCHLCMGRRGKYSMQSETQPTQPTQPKTESHTMSSQTHTATSRKYSIDPVLPVLLPVASILCVVFFCVVKKKCTKENKNTKGKIVANQIFSQSGFG